MKIQVSFSFTLFNDKNTNNLFSIGKSAFYQRYFLQPKTDCLNSEFIEINQNIFNAFFLCENLEILKDFNQNLVINTKI
jgi:hypothetical protein